MVVKARGKVRAEGKKDKLRLLADNVDYDRRSHLALASGKPALESTDERGRVASIHAQRLRLNTETRRAEAIDSVLVDRDTLKATGQYAVFRRPRRSRLALRPSARLGQRDHGHGRHARGVDREADAAALRRPLERRPRLHGRAPGSEGETTRLTGIGWTCSSATTKWTA
jgi:DNA-binding PucR family transcriptional regulator